MMRECKSSQGGTLTFYHVELTGSYPIMGYKVLIMLKH